MVTELIEKEIMTLPELKRKYSSKWFRYVIVGERNYKDPDKEKCYIVLTADSEEELYKYPYPDKNKHHGGVDSGYNVPFTPEAGGIYVHA